MDLREGGLYSDPVKLGVRDRIENCNITTKRHMQNNNNKKNTNKKLQQRKE